MHGLVRPERAPKPPSRGPGGGGREEAESQGAPGVHDQDLPLAVGEGRALPARAPDGRQLQGRGLSAEFDGSVGGPARGWAHAQ
eukprot:1305402-Alexandrium_andersonii.AAC.1